MIQHLIETLKSGIALEIGGFFYSHISNSPVLVTKNVWFQNDKFWIDGFPLKDKELSEETVKEKLIQSEYISINLYWQG